MTSDARRPDDLPPRRRHRRVGHPGRRRQGQGAARPPASRSSGSAPASPTSRRPTTSSRRPWSACRDPQNHRYTPGRRPARAEGGHRGQDAARLGLRGAAGPGARHQRRQARRLQHLRSAARTRATRCCCPAPYWTTYPEPIALAGGVSVVAAHRRGRPGFRVTVEQLEAARTPRTKALRVRVAVEPDRRRLPRGRGRGHRRWAVEHGIWVVTDEIYEHLTYGDHRVHVDADRSCPSWPTTCVVLNGVAKTYAMTGWRVGLDDRPGRRHQGGHQPAVPHHLERGQRVPARRAGRGGRRPRRRRRDARRLRPPRPHHPPLLNEIPGVTCIEPAGRVLRLPVLRGGARPRHRGPAAARPRSSWPRSSSTQAKVAIVPGEAFGAPGYARLSFALGDDDLVEGVARIADLLAQAVLSDDHDRALRHLAVARSPPTWSSQARSASARCVAGDDDIWWSELRPRRAAAVVVVRHTPGGAHRRRRCPRATRPAPGSTSTAAGPGGCTTTPSSSPTGPTSASTGSSPTSSPARSGRRAAHPRADRAPRRSLRRRRAHRGRPLGHLRARAATARPARPRPRNEIVAVDAERRAASRIVLVTGPDFVAAPRVSPDGAALCLDPVEPPRHAVGRHRAGGGRPRQRRRTAAGSSSPAWSPAGRDESITQPEWHADGVAVVRVRPLGLVEPLPNRCRSVPTASRRPPVAPLDGRGRACPHWVFGQSPLRLPGRRPRGPRLRVGRARPPGCRSTPARRRPTAPRPTSLVDLRRRLRRRWPPCAPTATVWCSSARPPTTRAAWSRSADLPAHGDATIGGHPPAARPRASAPSWFAEPRVARASDRRRRRPTHAVLYPPTHPQVARPGRRAAPPLLVLSHGGPTSAARPQLNLGVQFWTSGASPWSTSTTGAAPATGGPTARRWPAQWGVADVDDCVAVARHLADAGLVDADAPGHPGRQRRRLHHPGRPGLPRRRSRPAPASTAWPTSRPWPATPTSSSPATSTRWSARIRPRRDRYRERSPIHHVDGFDCPLLVLQGLEDEIVPPAQSEMIVDAVRRQGRARRLPGLRGRAARVPPGRHHQAGARGRAVLLLPGCSTSSWPSRLNR